jgi:hypothetical protein
LHRVHRGSCYLPRDPVWKEAKVWDMGGLSEQEGKKRISNVPKDKNKKH